MNARLPYGLYVITSEALCAETPRLLAGVAAALRGGAVIVQYRDKLANADTRLQRASRLRQLCAEYDVPLIINDDVALAVAVRAAGVHIGQGDGEVAAARDRLDPDQWLGVTCGNDLTRAEAARTAGADYVAFGRLFSSRTKPEAPPATLETVRAAQRMGIPLCAIGGLLPRHLPAVASAGVQLFAVVDGVFGADDIEAAARAYAEGLATYNCDSCHR